MSERAVRIHPLDNVAVASTLLRAGSTVTVAGDAVRVLEEIPSGHKIALSDITEGAVVVKYGEAVGRADELIPAGSKVGIHNVSSLRSRGRGSGKAEVPMSRRTQRRRAEKAMRGRLPELTGYRRADGRIGLRNHLLVLSTVSCANVAAERIAKLVPSAVAVTHTCGCPQIGDDLERTIRILGGHARHPNVGAVLLVGLGCESVPTLEIASALIDAGHVADVVMIQEKGGVAGAVADGAKRTKELLSRMAGMARETMRYEDLVVGTECGGSDAWSGITANPVIGAVCDRLVGEGATVLLPEVTEFVGAEHILAARADTPQVARAILDAVRRREEDAAKQGIDWRGGQPTPGNIAGGLTTIEEKSMGAIAKGGTTPVREVVCYGCRPEKHGLVVMDTPGSDIHSVTGMVAGGAQVVLFSTGRGTPTGSPIAPVIKVASNSKLFETMKGDLDFDAGGSLRDGSIDRCVDRLSDLFASVCLGQESASERLGARNFAIETLGLRL